MENKEHENRRQVRDHPLEITIGDITLVWVEEFVHLGTQVISNNDIKPEIQRRVLSANGSY